MSAAHCAALHDGFDRMPVCDNLYDSACPKFANTTTVHEFRNDRMWGVGGFIASNPTRRHVVVAFKGTDSLFDYATEMSKGMTET